MSVKSCKAYVLNKFPNAIASEHYHPHKKRMSWYVFAVEKRGDTVVMDSFTEELSYSEHGAWVLAKLAIDRIADVHLYYERVLDSLKSESCEIVC